MNIGDISGCLEVIGDCSETHDDLREAVEECARKEWNEFSRGMEWRADRFKEYYELTEPEAEAYDRHLPMPESFVDKYAGGGKCSYKLCSSPKFLYHKKKPDTASDLRTAIETKKLYRVRCRICNRTYMMDEQSFHCVKWRSCIGAECMENAVREPETDYSKTEYVWDEQSASMQVLDSQLAKVEELSSPLTYYGPVDKYDALKIAYISDIHLMHHLKFYDNDEDRMIKDIVARLYETMGNASVLIFGGDTSSVTRLTLKFYGSFMKLYDYKTFLEFKRNVLKMKQKKMAFGKMDDSKLKHRLEKLDDRISHNMEELSKCFDFSVFVRYREASRPDMTYEDAFEYYRKVKSYEKYALPAEAEQRILNMAILHDYKNRLDRALGHYTRKYESLLLEIQAYEEKYGKPIEEVDMTDYKEHRLLDTVKDVYVVLGNHEYIDFEDVPSCVSYYETELSRIGIKLLHNSSCAHEKFMIYGGTGFAGYDEKWNADSVVCCPNFSREDERKETELFEHGYEKALAYAKENGLCFLSVSHYPVSACLNGNYDKEAIYFTGHDHQNRYTKNAEKVLYADNQIGYKNNNIAFRIASTGYERNPYTDMQDGLYLTTIRDYLQFYRYIGEDIGKGKVLYQRCQNGKAGLYVVKRKGYYGFFILNPAGSGKGISIVNGGVTKKLTASTDMGWICENFEIVLSKYLQILTPLRDAQEQLSKELKTLGLYGTIHGCIVDIDFFHHIMLNPADGSVTFYYSPEFGLARKLDSFEDVIKSLERHNSEYSPLDCESIRRTYIEKSRDKDFLLGAASDSYLIEAEETGAIDASGREEQIVSRTDGMYGVSRKVNPLQRLFSGHVLRDYDLKLTETRQESFRNYSYKDRIFSYEGVVYKIIEDTGSEMIVAEEIQESEGMSNPDNETSLVTLTGNIRRFSLSALKTKISNKSARDTYWITTK